MKGNVKWFDSKKGYGFIIGEDKKEYFVHFSNISMEGYKTLKDNAKVEFELGDSPKGVQAVNVNIPKAEEQQSVSS